jgi:hypothetical protein
MGLAFLPPMLVAGAGDGSWWAAVPVLVGVLILNLGVMIASPFVMELIPGFGRPELTGTYFGIFYVVSGIAAAHTDWFVGDKVMLSRNDFLLEILVAIQVLMASGIGTVIADI